jgi:hypothetical protein
MCRVMTAKKKKRSYSSSLITQYFMVCWFSIIFFSSYYFFKFDKFIFSFQDTYNSRLKKRYGDNHLTYPDIDLDLWLEAGSSSNPKRNQVYELFNTTTKKLRMTRNALILGCSQSILSIQILESHRC